MFAAVAVSVAAAQAPAQPEHTSGVRPEPRAAARPGEHEDAAQPAEHAPAGEGEHGDSVWPLVYRLINFGILVGTLVYFLRKPIGTYLRNRGAEIRQDLVEAERAHDRAQAQIAAIDEKLRALPAEIEALRARGAEEVAAEEARINSAADAERERLLEHTRREIELRVRVAKQEIMREAAELAVGVAGERIRQRLTEQTHLRLVDRYADQVKEARTFHD